MMDINVINALKPGMRVRVLWAGVVRCTATVVCVSSDRSAIFPVQVRFESFDNDEYWSDYMGSLRPGYLGLISFGEITEVLGA